MSKLQSSLLKIFSIATIIISGITIGVSNYFTTSKISYTIPIYTSNYQLALILNSLTLVISVIYLFVFALKIKDKNINKKYEYLIVSLIIIFFGYALIVFKNTYSIDPSFDWKFILDRVETPNLENDWYLNNYNNNIFIVFYLKKIKQLFPLLAQDNFFGLNLLTSLSSVFVMYEISKKVLHAKKAIIVLIFSIFWLPFYWYNQAAYTDHLVLIYLLLIVLLSFEKNFEVTTKKWKYGVILIIAMIALSLKVTTIVILIAFMLVALFSKINNMNKLLSIMLLILSFLGAGLFRTQIEKNYKINTAENFPFIHWINMGQEDGWDSPADYNDYRNINPSVFPGGHNHKNVNTTREMINQGVSKKELNNYLKNEIKNKLTERGFINQTYFLLKKLTYTWFDPYFSTQTEMRQGETTEQYEKNKNFFESKKIYLFSKTYQNIVLISIFMSILYFIRSLFIKNKYRNIDFFLALSFIGILCFLSIWETRSRYLYMFWPLFITLSLSAVGSMKFKNNLSNLRK